MISIYNRGFLGEVERIVCHFTVQNLLVMDPLNLWLLILFTVFFLGEVIKYRTHIAFTWLLVELESLS